MRVFSQGAIGAPVTTLELMDARRVFVASVTIPAMDAPLDLIPKWTDVQLAVRPDIDISRGSITVDLDKCVKQITRRNNEIRW